MKTEQIRKNAAIIWNFLNENITYTEVNFIMEKCKIKKNDFFLSLGWLARENKINFFMDKNKVYIFLPEPNS